MKSALLTLLLVSCLTASCATDFTLSSSPPELSVYYKNRRLGATPLELSGDKLGPADDNGGYLLRFEKAGFQNVFLWFPKGTRGVNVTVNLEPFLVNERQVDLVLSKAKMDQLGEQMLAAQSEVLLAPNFTQSRVDNLSRTYSDISTVHYLAALIELRKGDKLQAKEKLKRALQISPAEPDYVVLYQELGGDPVLDLAEAVGAKKGKKQ